MYDQRNSGIRNGGLDGPGLNVVRFLAPPLLLPLLDGTTARYTVGEEEQD